MLHKAARKASHQPPVVMKFGGTSVEDARAFERVAEIVRARREMRPVVVVSALSGVTNALLAGARLAAENAHSAARHSLEEHFERHVRVAHCLLAGEAAAAVEAEVGRARAEVAAMLGEIAASPRACPLRQDVIVSYGERLSATLLTAVLRRSGLPATCVDARQCVITEGAHGGASPLLDETARHTRGRVAPLLASEEIPVMAGFIAASEGGAVTNLGRGGSDYTATLVGAALDAREVQIWTDVAGVFTADPHIVKGARTIPRLSYTEAATLAFFGAKVLHPKTIEPLAGRAIPLRVCNSRAPEEPGTLVCAEADPSPHTVKAITQKLGTNGVEHEEVHRHGPIVERGRALICMVGEGLREAPAVAARVALALTNMNALFVKHEVSDVLLLDVDEDRACEAVTRLHAAFF